MFRDGALGIIALVPDEWSYPVAVRHQILSRLAKYHGVVWIEPARNWREFLKPSSPLFLAGDRWSEPSPALEVLAAGWSHPNLHRPEWLSNASLRSRLAVARKRLIDRGATQIALYLWRDEYSPALDLVEHDISFYHIDDEYSFSEHETPNSARELELMRRVDQVIVHSGALLERKGGHNRNTALVPNGVDYHLFSTPCAEPADIARIPHPRIGYAGVIKKQLNFALVVRLAEARPQWSFVLVGPIGNVEGKEQDLARLRELSNVHFLGAKPAADLAAYVQHFDVCLMCYEVNHYTRYIYPLKLHEYLAAGRPTVSSPIETARSFANVVSIADNDEQWLGAIEQGLAEGDREGSAATARRSVARMRDWDTLVAEIVALFASAQAAKSSKPNRYLLGDGVS
jgi:glycosyltransferase involved in cell wall biosynthesis